MSNLSKLFEETPSNYVPRASGHVTAVRGPIVIAQIPQAAIGDLCTIELRDGSMLPAQIIAFEDDSITLAPFESNSRVTPGAIVRTDGQAPKIAVSDLMIGGVYDALGHPLKGHGYQQQTSSTWNYRNFFNASPCPLSRARIEQMFETGVSSIDNLCSIGYGQRLGLFAGAGVGKSTLLGMLARHSTADVNVIALVGERGREVREFIEECLGPEGLAKSVLVVATSDESSSRRRLAPYAATSIAEHFRAQGNEVLLLVDSLTRMARAIREVSVAAGELPVRQGYTNSVYTELPELLERAGTAAKGSITAIYTVLTSDAGDLDPLGEEIKSILDGHIVLSQDLALSGVRPAIDFSHSVSRLLGKLRKPEEIEAIYGLLSILHRLKKDKDILLLGGTPTAELKAAIEVEESLKTLLCQHPEQAPRHSFLEYLKVWQQFKEHRSIYKNSTDDHKEI